MGFCFNLLKKYNNIVSVFTDDNNSDVAIVEKFHDKYFITFNYLSSPCRIGSMGYNISSLDEANEIISRIRPKAYQA